jgi:hypothetical protein
MGGATIDRLTPRRARLGWAAWVGSLCLCAATAQAADEAAPSTCPGAITPAAESMIQPPSVVEQALPAGCARPTDRERSQSPRAPEHKRLPRRRDAPGTTPDGGIAPPDRRVRLA